jgi:hypothetical protein
MAIYCGQYQGVNVMADLSMKGNMLILNGSGSYRSRSDCYYEDEGLDCDNEGAEQTKGSYIKIEYCPFCGKKLESTDYEKNKLKDTIEAVKCKLERAKVKLALCGLRVNFTFVAKGDLYEKAKDMVWKDFTGKCELLPIKLETILKEFGNLKAHIIYGRVHEYDYVGDFTPAPALNMEEGIKFSGAGFGEFHGYTYCITEEQYEMMIDMGLCKKNAAKLKKIKEGHVKYQEEVKSLEMKLDELKKKLKKL